MDSLCLLDKSGGESWLRLVHKPDSHYNTQLRQSNGSRLNHIFAYQSFGCLTQNLLYLCVRWQIQSFKEELFSLKLFLDENISQDSIKVIFMQQIQIKTSSFCVQRFQNTTLLLLHSPAVLQHPAQHTRCYLHSRKPTAAAGVQIKLIFPLWFLPRDACLDLTLQSQEWSG